MDGNRRRDSSSLPVLADLTATYGCEYELNLLDSDSNSSLTVENSGRTLFQIGDSTKDCLTAWTDEKHHLYLDHLESSFVEQLHRSVGVLAWCSGDDSKGPCLPRKLTRNSSEQLKMVQDDCSEKIDRKRSQPVLNHVADSLVLKSHHMCGDIQRFVKATKLHDSSTVRKLYSGDENNFFNEAEIHSKQITSRHGTSHDCIPEFSDQNFADEASEQMCVTMMSKRSKIR